MKEIIWLGRGGQGAFTAAKLLGAAFALESDKYALAFPSFGPERRGAPVKAFTKLDTKPVTDRSQTEKADHIVILDETLYSSELYDMLKPHGTIIINSRIPYEGAYSFDGEGIAKEFRLPTVNTVMLGLLTGLYRTVSLDNAVQAIKEYMPEKIQDKNIGALKKAAEEVL